MLYHVQNLEELPDRCLNTVVRQAKKDSKKYRSFVKNIINNSEKMLLWLANKPETETK